MNYQVGIDLGTTFTAAAVCRQDDQTQIEVVPLGSRGAAVPSVVFVAEDESLVIGEAATRRALTDPHRVVREFKRRIGDATPLVVGGKPLEPQALAAKFVRWVVDRVAEREGGSATGIAVTHPAAWGPHKQELLAKALAHEGLADATLVSEPTAAAVAYAHAQHMEPDATVGVYDLGGGTFDAAIVRKLPEAEFELLGRSEGIERLGGIDFDQLVFEHVRSSVGEAWGELDISDPAIVSAVARLRQECNDAKEALSADTEVVIPVLLPGLNTQVRLVRSEFEEMIRPSIGETVEALVRAVDSAALTPAELSAVLLVGGSSRIPLVAQLVSEQLDRPVTIDADPKTSVAVGAALSITRGITLTAAAIPQPESLDASAAERGLDTEPARPPISLAEPDLPQQRVGSQQSRLTRTLVTAAVAIVAALASALAVGASALGVGETSTEPPPVASKSVEPSKDTSKASSAPSATNDSGGAELKSFVVQPDALPVSASPLATSPSSSPTVVPSAKPPTSTPTPTPT
ncbi:MAG: Hsp70 family protein, partial [Acidimicrobiales bacterium]